jgi:hypothetical protein
MPTPIRASTPSMQVVRNESGTPQREQQLATCFGFWTQRVVANANKEGCLESNNFHVKVPFAALNFSDQPAGPHSFHCSSNQRNSIFSHKTSQFQSRFCQPNGSELVRTCWEMLLGCGPLVTSPIRDELRLLH